MVRDRFIGGQAECALRRHLDSLGPDTPMRDIIDSCCVWKSHNEVAIGRNGGSDRCLQKVAPIPSDREMLIQHLLRAIRPPQPVIQKRSKLTDIEILLQNRRTYLYLCLFLESLEGCFSCGELTQRDGPVSGDEWPGLALASGQGNGVPRW